MTPSPSPQESVSERHSELFDTLRDIEAFFRKEYAYEVENAGSGGSQIAAGRWKRYYMALYNLLHDLPELIANDVELQRLRQGAARAGDWVSEQYQKIQDFVVSRRLYKDQPDNLSHADLVLALAEKQLAQGAATDVRTAGEGLTQEQREGGQVRCFLEQMRDDAYEDGHEYTGAAADKAIADYDAIVIERTQLREHVKKLEGIARSVAAMPCEYNRNGAQNGYRCDQLQPRPSTIGTCTPCLARLASPPSNGDAK